VEVQSHRLLLRGAQVQSHRLPRLLRGASSRKLPGPLFVPPTFLNSSALRACSSRRRAFATMQMEPVLPTVYSHAQCRTMRATRAAEQQAKLREGGRGCRPLRRPYFFFWTSSSAAKRCQVSAICIRIALGSPSGTRCAASRHSFANRR
jgi:hypothetical protein